MFTMIVILTLQNIGVITAQPLVVNTVCYVAVMESESMLKLGKLQRD